jgi:hypothetical protein
MSKKRLQVVLAEDEYREIERIARVERMTVSEWVRLSLRRAGRARSSGQVDQKLAAVRAAARHEYPAGDIDEILQEIERGYVGDA